MDPNSTKQMHSLQCFNSSLLKFVRKSMTCTRIFEIRHRDRRSYHAPIKKTTRCRYGESDGKQQIICTKLHNIHVVIFHHLNVTPT